jgi:hypothetical protein
MLAEVFKEGSAHFGVWDLRGPPEQILLRFADRLAARVAIAERAPRLGADELKRGRGSIHE